MTYPAIHQSFSQIGPQTAEQSAGTRDQPSNHRQLKKSTLYALGVPPGGRFGKGTHDLLDPPPKVSAKLVHRHLRKNTFYAPGGPPWGRSGCHLVAMVPITYPTLNQSFSQIGPQTAEQSPGTPDQASNQLALFIYIEMKQTF